MDLKLSKNIYCLNTNIQHHIICFKSKKYSVVVCVVFNKKAKIKAESYLMLLLLKNFPSLCNLECNSKQKLSNQFQRSLLNW